MGATTWYQSIFRRNRNQDGDWFGKYWASYGQAVEEAGFASNKLQEAYGVEALNIRFIELIREIGKIPVKGELLLKRWQDSSFPNEKVFSRFDQVNVSDIAVVRFMPGFPHCSEMFVRRFE